MITWWDFPTRISLVYLISFSHSWFTAIYYLANINNPSTRQEFIIYYPSSHYYLAHILVTNHCSWNQDPVITVSPSMTSASVWLEYSVKSQPMTPCMIQIFLIEPYSIVHFYWTKSVDYVSFGHISAACINIVLVIVTTTLMVSYAVQFWCEAPASLNLIFCWFFNRYSIKYEVLNIPLSLFYTLITTTWLWYPLFKNAHYRVWRPSIELESKKSSIKSKNQSIQIEQQNTIVNHSTSR